MDAPELSSPRLRAFVAVARAGGFSSGARSLGLSQSSVSQAIAALEEEIAQPLFVRAARRVHLTEAGSILLEHAERAIAELGRAADLIAGLGNLSRGRLRVGTSDTLAAYLLPPLFAEFRERYPGIELQLENRPSPAVAQAVGERRVDLGVVSLPLPGAPNRGRSLRIEALAPQRDVIIAAPTHRFSKRRELSFEQLLEERLVLLDPSTATRSLFERHLRKIGVRAQVVMEMSSVEVIKRLVEQGFGLSVIPAMAVEREVRDGTLRALRLTGGGDASYQGERRVALVTHPRSALSGAARAFAELLRKRLAANHGAKVHAPRKT